jgi:hypothetical protein
LAEAVASPGWPLLSPLILRCYNGTSKRRARGVLVLSQTVALALLSRLHRAKLCAARQEIVSTAQNQIRLRRAVDRSEPGKRDPREQQV